MRIVLGVGGGIAAYKAALLLRLFTEDGHEVTHFDRTGDASWSITVRKAA